MKRTLSIFLVVIVLAVLAVFTFYLRDAKVVSQINSFEECASQGFPVMESYPRQCQTPDGRLFVEELEEESAHPLIRVFSPALNETISSPFKVAGEARGNWFFEASFPIELLDADGNSIPIEPGFIMTSENWMTEDFVPFEAEISFSEVNTATGTLVLHKDNPSGLPENDDKITIPVEFSQSVTDDPENGSSSDCIVTGCSGQICAEEEVATTCEFLPQYACYSSALCERQPDGECGWTETPEFTSCMNNL